MLQSSSGGRGGSACYRRGGVCLVRGVLVLLKFWVNSQKLGSSGATECRVWIGNLNVKVWKSAEHKLHKIWRSLKFQQNEHTPGVGSAWCRGCLSGPGGCLSGPGGCLPGPGGSPFQVGGSSLAGGVVCLVPGGSPCPEIPPINKITDTCKNITLATTSLRPVIIG